MRYETKHIPLAPRQGSLSGEVSALPALGEFMGDSSVCSKCHFCVILCFPNLQCCIHLLDSQPTQQPYKLCSCWIWSEFISFLFGNSSSQWHPCKAEGGSHWNKTCFCDTDIFEAAWLRHINVAGATNKNNCFTFAPHFLPLAVSRAGFNRIPQCAAWIN